ncbi:hypothetical protein AWC38_SpisGene3879 [Stylophora pistillata]|uniref:Uncharacterized protein n=1 Tax=Stylophora pistillata TaxID=50429 RepID=A0A2B4SSE4_STYPI|nr:hypothetical protein AWC38_SpisGene3879 [Stylophora pistillata]
MPLSYKVGRPRLSRHSRYDISVVGIDLHPLRTRPFLHGGNSVLHVTQGAAGYGLGDCRIVNILPRGSENLEIIDHEQEKPGAELGPLRNSGGDWTPLRETVRGQLDALVSIRQKVSHPGFDAVRYVEPDDLSDKYHMIDKIKGLAIVK